MRALATALLGVAVATAPALAQKAHKYDPNAEVTVAGVVVDYHESKSRNDHPGLHFILEIAPAPEAEPGAAAGVAPVTPVASTAPATVPPAAQAVEPAVGVVPEPPAVAAPEPAPAPPPVAEAETVEVHACPVKLLSQLDFPIEKGDELTVTGSRPAGGPIIIARELKKGVVSLQLRDEEGVPIWTGLR